MTDIVKIDIDLDEWEYFAEGNTKIIYVNKSVHSPLSGMILKLSKISDIRKLNIEVNAKRCCLDNIFVGTFLPGTINPDYLPNVGYVIFDLENEILDSLNPSLAFYCSLHLDQVLQRCQIDNPNRKGSTCLSPIGILESNMCHRGNNLNSCHSLSFELKVKCGFRSFSPFLRENRSIKHRINRFQLLQLSKAYDRIHKGSQPRWGDISSISKYNPIQLMSVSSADIKTAVRALFSNPQNNLGMRLDGKLLYGWGKDEVCANDARLIIDLLHNDDIDSSTDSEIHVDLPWMIHSIQALADVIEQEPLFQQIKTLQALDVIDVDGCEVIFRHLVHLVGSEAVAIDLIDTHVTHPMSSLSIQYLSEIAKFHEDENRFEREQSSVFSCHVDSESVCSRNSSFIELSLASVSEDSRLTVLLHEVLRFGMEKHCPDRILHGLSSTDSDIGDTGSPLRDDFDERLSAWIDALSIADCVLLLSAWLVALTASDMSVMITFKQTSNADIFSSNEHCDGGSLPGPLKLKPLKMRSQTEYSIGLIDFYPKPASKIVSKIRLEDDICCNATKMTTMAML